MRLALFIIIVRILILAYEIPLLFILTGEDAVEVFH